MSAKLFIDFDQFDRPSPLSNGVAYTLPNYKDIMVPEGVRFAPQSGSSIYSLTDRTPTIQYVSGRTPKSHAFSFNNFGFGQSDPNGVNYGGFAIPRSIINNPNEVWVTCDWSPLNTFATQTRNTSVSSLNKEHWLFGWGDIGVRLYSTTPNPSKTDIIWQITNTGEQISSISNLQVNPNDWFYAKMHVRLDAISGLVDISIGGISQTGSPYTGQNTVKLTSLQQASHVFVGPVLSNYNYPTHYISCGAVDNIYFDNVGFPSGRPRGELLNISGLIANNGFTAINSANSIASGLISSGLVQGGPSDAFVILGLNEYSTEGLLPEMIGYNMYAVSGSNMDQNFAKKLAMGLNYSGEFISGFFGATAGSNLPAYPSSLSWVEGIYNHTGIPFVTGDIPNSFPELYVYPQPG